MAMPKLSDYLTKEQIADLISECHAGHEKAPISEGLAYFAGEPDAGPVKIGFSRDLKTRMKILRTAEKNQKLVVLASVKGGRAREGTYHMQFEDYRLHGEWFSRCDEILAEIERINRRKQDG